MYINQRHVCKYGTDINQAHIYKSKSDILYQAHIYKSDRYLAKSVSYLYIRGRYTNIAFVSVFDTLGTP